jgi:small multidrug resistance pump
MASEASTLLPSASSSLPTFLGLPLTPHFAWAVLFVAICAEVGGTVCMKLARGFTVPGPSIMIFAFYAVSFTLMPIVLRVVDLSTAYAVWSGMGTLITAIIGFCAFRESAEPAKVFAIFLIISGVVLLKYVDGSKEEER